MSLTEDNQKILLDLAYQSIKEGLVTGHPLSISPRDYSLELRQQKATFVSLKKNNQLRGCVGMLNAVLPLVEDVVENAFSAAFNDPRFSPLTLSELTELKIYLSVLSPSVAIEFVSEDDLIAQIRPNIDGLILESGSHYGSFLPSIWQTIPSSSQFLKHLKQKAGLTKDYWSDQVRVYRYTTEIIAQH